MSEREPLLLLPGTLCDRRLYGPVVDFLGRPDAEVPSLLGAESAAAMAALILDEAPERFALAGFSLGGFVALEMVAQARDRVIRLALIDTNAHPDPTENAAVRREGLALARSVGIERYVRERLGPRYLSKSCAETQATLDLIVAMARSLGLEALRTQTEIALGRIGSRQNLAELDVPVLVLCGEEDFMSPPAAHREIASVIRGAKFAVLPACGHFAPLERPSEVATLMAEWLARLSWRTPEPTTRSARSA